MQEILYGKISKAVVIKKRAESARFLINLFEELS